MRVFWTSSIWVFLNFPWRGTSAHARPGLVPSRIPLMTLLLSTTTPLRHMCAKSSPPTQVQPLELKDPKRQS
ncbi:hypothetical protein BKA80DRAFT_281571 [Phyllosticta citrichinensis]